MKAKCLLIGLLFFSINMAWSQGFTISGTKLLDANGNEFVIKGINVPLAWFVANVNSNITNIKANTNVNTLRIVVTTTTADADWQSCVQKCIDNKIIPMVELHDVTGNNTPSELNRMAQFWASKAAYLTQPQIAKYILINIANEWSDWNMSANATGTISRVTWRDAYITAVKTIRDAGIKTTLVIDAGGYGQDNKTQTILSYAKSVQTSDTYHNCLFSIHMYCEWSVGGNSNISTLLPGVKNSGIPIIVGEFGWEEGNGNGGYCDIDESLIISTANTNGIGWIAWSWKGNGGGENVLDLSNDWAGTNLSGWGNTVVNGAGGTKTAVVATVFTSTSNPAPTVTIVSPTNNTAVCAGTSVTITATAAISSGSVNKIDFYDGATLLGSDNSSPYSYTWNSPSAGVHTIRAIATSALSAVSAAATSTVTVDALPTAVITATTPTTFCAGGGVTFTASAGTSYKWMNGTIQVGTAQTYTASTAGAYTVEVTNGNNCKAISSATTVTVNAMPAAPAVTATATYCQNAPVARLTATGTGLKWYTSATGGIGQTTAPTPTTATAGTTNYYASQTTNTCESARALIAVTVNALPTAVITATTPTTFCAGGSVTLTASTGTSYKWMNGTTQVGTAQTYTASTAGAYTIEVTNGNNCKATSSATTVTVNAMPAVPAVTTPATYCQNAPVAQLTATGTGLKWYTSATGGIGQTTAPTPLTTTTGTTNYYASQTTNTCESARALIAVTVNALPTAVITATTPTTFCAGGNVTLTASAGTSYKWMNGTTQVGTAQTYTASTAGAYTVEVTNGNNCKATSSATTVTVNAIPAAPAVTATVTYCQNAPVAQLTATGTGLKWYTAATGGIGQTAVPTPLTTTAGTTNYYVSQTTNTCESARAFIAVTVNALPAAAITSNGSTAIVQGGTVVLQANAGSGLSYVWHKGNIQVGTNSNYTATEPGSYIVDVTNSNNCTSTSVATNVTIATNQSSVITITSPQPNATVSGAIDIAVDVTDPDGDITLVEFLDGITVIGTSTAGPYTFKWDNPSAGNHSITVRVTDSNGGVTTSAAVNVTSGTITTGIQSGSSINAVVYPNPSSGVVYIETDADLSQASFMMIDVLGREVILSSALTGNGARVDVSGLNEGTYVFIINGNDSILRKKITVIR